MDAQSEVGRFFEKLGAWRQESDKEFINIVKFHSSSIYRGINNLVQEVSDLKVKLSDITKEKNDLLQTVHKLSNNGSQRNVASPLQEHLPGIEVINTKDTQEDAKSTLEVEDAKEQTVVTMCTISSETVDQVDSTFTESVDLDVEHIVSVEEMAGENVNEENSKQIKIEGRNEPKEIAVNSKPIESTQSESIYCRDVVRDGDHVCPECTFKFLTSEDLEIHWKKSHANPDKIIARESIHICPECGYVDSEKRDLKERIEEANKKIRTHICGECGYVYGIYSTSQKGTLALKQHNQGLHKKNHKYMCEDCAYSSPSQSQLKEHIKAVHDKIRDNVCGECDYSASCKETLKRHIEAVHKKMKNHVCGECGYGAPKKSTLKRHRETVHNVGEKKFTCDFCSYKAYIKDNLRRHVKNVHLK